MLLTNDEAIVFLANLRRDAAVSFADEPFQTRDIWFRLAAGSRPSPNLWMDAFLTAFAISLDAELVTFDRGFLKFESSGLALRLLENSQV